MATSRPIKSLYVHIPFCAHLCHYCDFTKMLYEPTWASRYLERLFFEIDQYRIAKLDTIYVGGGTPSALRPDQLDNLLKKLAPLLNVNGEFTVEANIENTSSEKLMIMKRWGVNRISFGVQSFNDELLKHMNRAHKGSDVNSIIAMARSIGFDDISVDLIYDLPGQTDAMLLSDIEAVLALDVPHISTYALSVHPHTVYGIRQVKEASDDVSRQHYDCILSRLRKAGYQRYEVSNFARPGYEGRHNLTYWNNEYYYGVGLGASGYIPGFRYTNTRNFTKYLAGVTIDEREAITLKDAESYYLLLKLRLERGFLKDDYHSRFQIDFSDKYQHSITKLKRSGLLQEDEQRWYATDDGLMLLDQVVVTLLKEID